MTNTSTPYGSTLFELTDDEAVTLRRIAFGQSELRSLRRADIDRLVRLRLIVERKGDLALTASGREHFESLPRSSFADESRRRDGWQR
jgi:hypothetical protein